MNCPEGAREGLSPGARLGNDTSHGGRGDNSQGPHENCGFRGRGGTAEGTTIHVCVDGSDLELVTTSSPSRHATLLKKVAKATFLTRRKNSGMRRIPGFFYSACSAAGTVPAEADMESTSASVVSHIVYFQPLFPDPYFLPSREMYSRSSDRLLYAGRIILSAFTNSSIL